MRARKLSESDFQTLSEEYAGICIECGEIQDSGVEPDAHGYECNSCGKSSVYGLEEALLLGYVEIE